MSEKTAANLLAWIKSWTPEQAKAYHELGETIEKALAKTEPLKWAIEELSGACKLHYHDSCGYSKCKCICHKPMRNKVN